MAKKGKIPDPPNFSNAAFRTSQSSRPDWSGPTGGQSWETDPKTGKTKMSVTTPYQGTFDTLKGTTESAASMDPSKAFDKAVDTNMEWGMSRLNPLFQQQNDSYRSQMANSGLDPGTEAYGKANQALGAKQADMFGTAFKDALNMGNETQRTQIAQQMVPFQQLASLTNSTMQTPYMGAPANYLGAAQSQWGADLGKASAENAKKGKLMEGAQDLAGSGAMLLSDERLKMNIIRHGSIELYPGVPLAVWEWKSKPGKKVLGVIAQDLEKVAPQYVHIGPDGYRRVDYSFLNKE